MIPDHLIYIHCVRQYYACGSRQRRDMSKLYLLNHYFDRLGGKTFADNIMINLQCSYFQANKTVPPILARRCARKKT